MAKIRRIKRETGLSYRKAAASLGVSHTLVIHWCALRELFDNIDLKRLPRYSVAHGPCGQLEGVTEELLAWIFERREIGLVVSTLSVIIKACCILPIMEQKSALARVMVMRRFLKKHSLVYRMGTKVSQRSPSEVGDTIFMPDFGTARCDFPGGSSADLYDSVTRGLYGTLADDARVFVGHDYQPGGRELQFETTIGEEKNTNRQLNASTSREEFAAWRSERDGALGMPNLIVPALQVNLRGGEMPRPESNGVSYLKIPVNLLGGEK